MVQKKYTIELIVTEGLCNRMRALDSALALSRKIHSKLVVYWILNNACNCPFEQLFLPISGVEIKSGDPFQPEGDFFLGAYDIKEMLENNFDFVKELKGKNVVINSFSRFYSGPVYYKDFHPIEELQKRIDTNNILANTVGVHIRRTDNKNSIQYSPLNSFIKAMNEEDEHTQFYLASDDDDVKNKLQIIFGMRITTSNKKVERNSIKGIQNALVELYTLAKTKKILGSYYSSYSHTAADLGKIPEVTIEAPKLSFCITCKNRISQIRKTLPKNLNDNRMDEQRVEFILIDFESTDGLKKWIEENFQQDLYSGYLKYYHTKKLHYWHASIAKNTAHFYANNEIVVNLDCDNYTGYRGGHFIIQQFIDSIDCKIILHQFNQYGDGSYGRISVFKDFFDKIGGYDEAFEPMGYQDTDLILRLNLLGLQYVRSNNPMYCQAEKNTKAEGILHTGSNLSWVQMENLNKKKSKEKIAKGIIHANNGLYGLRSEVFPLIIHDDENRIFKDIRKQAHLRN